MFFKDNDPSSKEIRFLPGASQVWEKADYWKPLPFYDDNGDEYIYWYSGVDVCSYIRGTIGGIPFSELKVDVKCRADNSDEFYGKGLKGIIGV